MNAAINPMKKCNDFDDCLIDWWQKKHHDCLVNYLDRLWFVKYKPPYEKRRNFLAFYLGKTVANIAEPREITENECRDLILCGANIPETATPRNTFLVRFVLDYGRDELVKNTLESAFASEMVFSMWIRRRDAHSYNRSFVHGIPVFFDHEIAFLSEKHTRSTDGFFSTGPDAGYAGLWRLNPGEHSHLDTMSLRREESGRFAGSGPDRHTYFPVRNTELFLAELKKSVDEIKSIPKSRIADSIKQAGFPFLEGMRIKKFLLSNQSRLEHEAERLRSILSI